MRLYQFQDKREDDRRRVVLEEELLFRVLRRHTRNASISRIQGKSFCRDEPRWNALRREEGGYGGTVYDK